MDPPSFARFLFQLASTGSIENDPIQLMKDQNPYHFLELCLCILQNNDLIPEDCKAEGVIFMDITLASQIFRKFNKFDEDIPFQQSLLIPLVEPFIQSLDPFLLFSHDGIRNQAAKLYAFISEYALNQDNLPILPHLLDEIVKTTNENLCCSICVIIFDLLNEELFSIDQKAQIASALFPLLLNESTSIPVKSQLLLIFGCLQDILTEQNISQFISAILLFTNTPILSSSCWNFWDDVIQKGNSHIILAAPKIIELSVVQLSKCFSLLSNPEQNNSEVENISRSIMTFLTDLFNESEENSPYVSLTRSSVDSLIPIVFSYLSSSVDADEDSLASDAHLLLSSIGEVFPEICTEVEKQYLTANANSELPGVRNSSLICLLELASNLPEELYPNVFPAGIALIASRLQENPDENPSIIVNALDALTAIAARYSEPDYSSFIQPILYFISSSNREFFYSAQIALETLSKTPSCIPLIPAIIKNLFEIQTNAAIYAIGTIIKKTDSSFCSLLYDPAMNLSNSIYTKLSESPTPSNESQCQLDTSLRLLKILIKKTEFNPFVEKIGQFAIQINMRFLSGQSLSLLIAVCSAFGQRKTFFVGSTITLMLNTINNASRNEGIDPSLLKSAIKGIRNDGLQTPFGLIEKIHVFSNSLVNCLKSSLISFEIKVEAMKSLEFIVVKYGTIISPNIIKILQAAIGQLNLLSEDNITQEEMEGSLDMASSILGVFLTSLLQRIIHDENRDQTIIHSINTIQFIMGLPIESNESFQKVFEFLVFMSNNEALIPSLQKIIQSDILTQYILNGLPRNRNIVNDFFSKVPPIPHQIQEALSTLN